MRTVTMLVLGLGLGVLLTAGCSTAPRTETARRSLERDAETTIDRFKTADPSLERFFDRQQIVKIDLLFSRRDAPDRSFRISWCWFHS